MYNELLDFICLISNEIKSGGFIVVLPSYIFLENIKN